MGLKDVKWRPPLLTTERLLLRGIEPTDLEAVWAYASNPEVPRYMVWDEHRSLEDSREFLDGFVASSYEERQLEYGICPKEQPELLLGCVGVRVKSRKHQVMEMGYVLRRSAWANGYLPEAGGCLVRYAFETTNVQRIYAPIFAENTRSRRAAEKMGMKLDGVLRSSLYFKGRRWEEAIYSVLRGEV